METTLAREGDTAPPTMTLEDVCAVLQYSQRRFGEIRPQLEAAGFPRKLPGTARWPRKAVINWIDAGGAS